MKESLMVNVFVNLICYCYSLGSDPSLPCIFLNSHYDVVPVVKVRGS